MHLPPKVRVKNGAYHYDLGRDENGVRHWKKLCRISEGESALYRALADITTPDAKTLGALFDDYLASDMFRQLAPRTQKDYLSYLNGKLRLAFGKFRPASVHSGNIAQYLEARLGMGAGVLANKEIACLSSVFNYGMRKGKCKENPCRGVRRNTQRPRTRYIQDDELNRAYAAAPEAFKHFLEALYLTGLRQGDIRRMKRSQIMLDCIRVGESKTGKVVKIAMSDALRSLLLRAQTRAPNSPYVFTNTRGDPWGEWAIQSQVRRIREKIGRYDWTLHDVRAKAESDHAEGLGLLPLYRRVHRIRPVR